MAILDGKLVADKIQGELRLEIAKLKKELGLIPGLVVIMAGDDPASSSYVNSKSKLAEKLGIRSALVKLPESVAAEEIVRVIESSNADPLVHAILVQMPLPAHLDSWKILDHIRPEKDVDCFHPFNQGLILQNRARLFPCTPGGVMKILDHYGIDPSGLNAAVVGRSFLVGKPMAAMLANANATVTLCHSRTVGTWAASCAQPTWSWPRWASPGSSAPTWSSREPSWSTWASTISRMTRILKGPARRPSSRASGKKATPSPATSITWPMPGPAITRPYPAGWGR